MELYILVSVVCLIVLTAIFFIRHKKSTRAAQNTPTKRSESLNPKRKEEPKASPKVTTTSKKDEQLMREAREMVQSMNQSSEKKNQVSYSPISSEPDMESVEDTREKKKLYKELVENNFYCKSNVSLETCSKKLGISTRQLSARIKKHHNKSFLQYINDLRMEKVVALIKDENITKVNDLMYMTGYKNRTTFNNLFKKKMNMTVTEFRESLKKEVEPSL